VHELLNAQDTVLCLTLRRDQESGGQVGVELETWKKLFKRWTVSFEGWGETARWTEERRMASRRCKRTH
jgi:hypothetical protein